MNNTKLGNLLIEAAELLTENSNINDERKKIVKIIESELKSLKIHGLIIVNKNHYLYETDEFINDEINNITIATIDLSYLDTNKDSIKEMGVLQYKIENEVSKINKLIGDNYNLSIDWSKSEGMVNLKYTK